MEGDALRKVGIGTAHRKFHESLEKFWDQFRRGGDRFGKPPTNGEYGAAMEKALLDTGVYSAEEAAYLALEARFQRIAHGLLDSDLVPCELDIPKRMYPK
jgi:hypothetical protein